MLRKTGGQSGPPKSRYDDDNKGGKQAKLQRQSKERVKSTLLFLLLLGVIGCGALYAFQDSTDFDPFGPGFLRTRLLKKKKLVYQNPALLPPDSIYHLSVNDCNGESVSLDQFSGSVALIVNVASH